MLKNYIYCRGIKFGMFFIIFIFFSVVLGLYYHK
jgi:hypothetical protein